MGFCEFPTNETSSVIEKRDLWCMLAIRRKGKIFNIRMIIEINLCFEFGM